MNDRRFSPPRPRRALATLAVATLALALAGCGSSSDEAIAMATQAQQLLDSGQARLAQQKIGAAIAERDDLPQLYIVQGRIATVLADRGGAYQAYANALALDTTDQEALMGVAQFGLGVGRLREAEAAADKLLTLNPQQVSALLIKGICALAKNDDDSAGKFADRILAVNAEDPGGLMLKSRAMALRGDRAGALALLRDNAAKAGYSPEMAMSLVELYRGSGDLAGYLAMLERLRTLVPGNLAYRLDLVDALYRAGRRDDARAETAKLLDADFKDPAPIEGLIRIWYAYDPAAFGPEQLALAAKNASVEARLAIARFLVATQRPAAAIALLRPVASGWSVEVQALLARAVDRSGNHDAAARALPALLRRDAGNGDALLLRASRTVAAGHPADAIVDLQRVATGYPQWDEGFLALAAAYDASGKPLAAQHVYEDAMKARPQSWPVATAYVAWLERRGDGERARIAARRFARASPSLVRGWQFYAAVCARHEGDGCRSEAADGLAAARTHFGLDLPPGTPPPIGLIGRLA